MMFVVSRFSTFMPGHYIQPRLDALGPSRRLDAASDLMPAYLGGRPVILARPERLPSDRLQTTVPITVSRLRRAIDIEREGASRTYDPSMADSFPLSHAPASYGQPYVTVPVFGRLDLSLGSVLQALILGFGAYAVVNELLDYAEA